MGRSRSSLVALAITAALCLTTPARADRWETTRLSVIDPVNSEFHRHLPTYVKARDLGQILSLYATNEGGGLEWEAPQPIYPGREEEMLRWQGPTGAEAIRDRYQRLLDGEPIRLSK